jgi:hypothetical protein
MVKKKSSSFSAILLNTNNKELMLLEQTGLYWSVT